MIWTIAVIFALVWALGLVTAYTLGGVVHILLGVAVLLFLIGAFQSGVLSGRRRGALPPAASAGKAEKHEKKAPAGAAAHSKGGPA